MSRGEGGVLIQSRQSSRVSMIPQAVTSSKSTTRFSPCGDEADDVAVM